MLYEDKINLFCDGVLVEPQTVGRQHEPVLPPLVTEAEARSTEQTLNQRQKPALTLYLLGSVQFDQPTFLKV